MRVSHGRHRTRCSAEAFQKRTLARWPSRTRERKRRQVARAAHVGGGGGTADPSLSRRAGLCLHPANRMRGVLSVHRSGRILVPARCASSAVSRPMSLYRAGLRFALFLPLGVAIPPAVFPPCGCRVRRCEPRCHSTLTGRGDYLTNRTRVRKRYTCRTTCLVSSFDLAPLPPTDRLQQCQSPSFDVSPK